LSDKQSTLFPNTSAVSKTLDTLNVLQGLPRSEIEPLAFKILRVVEPWCRRVEIAGSFRRGKAVINDLDIVVQPQPSIGCWPAILRSVREDFDAVTEKQGDKLATLYLPFASKQGNGHVQVDFYRADPTT
jgi:DNA polymerase/3'-5' exonuclease PolX